MKAYCCECGRPVPMTTKDGKEMPGHCAAHPSAKRYTEKLSQKWFIEIWAAVNGATNRGRASHLAVNSWVQREIAARKAGLI